MRLFIAIPLPENVKQKLVDLQQPIDGVRWQNSTQIHLTLKFLGDCITERVKELRQYLGNVSYSSFRMTMNGLGYFPENRQPTVIWAGVEESDPLMNLQKIIEEKCTELGFEPESRPFKPHVTLGRVKDASKSDVLSLINKHKQFSIDDMLVTEFVLYQSKLHPDGARYHRLHTFELLADEEMT